MKPVAVDDFQKWVALEPIRRADEKRLRWVANDRRIWHFNAASDAATAEGLSAWLTAALDGCDEGRQRNRARLARGSHGR